MKDNDFSCWLNGQDAAIAKALIFQADFIYCGREDEFIAYDEEIGNGYKLAKCYGWQLASARGEVALEAVKDGAVFGKCLEVLPDVNFEAEVKLAKRVIRAAAQEWEENHVIGVQLVLF